MKNAHLTFERVIEAATGEKPLNSLEKEHVDNCSLCQGRINAALSTDKVLKDSEKVVPLIDRDRIIEMADKVFDQETLQKKTLSVYRIIAVAASLIIIVATVAFFAGKESPKPVKTPEKTARKKDRFRKRWVNFLSVS